MIATGSFISCGCPLRAAFARSRSEHRKYRRTKRAPAPPASSAQSASRSRHPRKQINAGRAILHHRDQFRGSLPRVKRNHDQALRHDCQIHRHPVDTVVRPAARSGRLSSGPCSPRKARACAIIHSNSARSHRLTLRPRAISRRTVAFCRRFELRKNVFEKTHAKFSENSALGRSASCSLDQTAAARHPSAANNLPNSIRPCAWETPDTAAALPPRSTLPCAPSLSDCAPPFAQCHRRCAHLPCASFSSAASSFGSRSASSTFISKS